MGSALVDGRAGADEPPPGATAAMMPIAATTATKGA
jgi:hypothetical protein